METTDSRIPLVHENQYATEGLRFACIRLMEIASAVLVRTASTEAKVALSQDVWGLAQCADTLGQRLPGLRSKKEAARPINAAYVQLCNDLAAIEDPDRQLDRLTRVAYADLRAATAALLVRLDPLVDEAGHQCLTWVLDRLGTLHRPLGDAEEGGPSPLFDSCAGRAGEAEPPVTVTSTPALTEIPVRPGRDPRLREHRPGIDPAGVGELSSSVNITDPLHDVAFKIELCAAEICATLLALHPEAPWGLRHDLARQVRDEGRHFELLITRMRELGGTVGSHPVRFQIWDKFRLGRTLPERILIEQRLGEGIGLDGGLRVYRWLQQIGDTRTATIFDYINADEVTHVGNANHWLEELLGGADEVRELDARVRDLLAGHDMPVRHMIPINVEDRALSGFSAEEIAALQEEWARERAAAEQKAARQPRAPRTSDDAPAPCPTGVHTNTHEYLH
ncbi:DUF455 family protein [Streptomyces sp. NPDC059467]|uniref:DUF455 family protein n=1 Tax=Streptomyces sp. NPDC059467 TaxID=3346844 RepID=UPI0036A0CE90